MAHVQKHCNNAKSTVEVKNWKGAYRACAEAIDECRPYYQGQCPNIGEYIEKPPG